MKPFFCFLFKSAAYIFRETHRCVQLLPTHLCSHLSDSGSLVAVNITVRDHCTSQVNFLSSITEIKICWSRRGACEHCTIRRIHPPPKQTRRKKKWTKENSNNQRVRGFIQSASSSQNPGSIRGWEEPRTTKEGVSHTLAAVQIGANSSGRKAESPHTASTHRATLDDPLTTPPPPTSPENCQNRRQFTISLWKLQTKTAYRLYLSLGQLQVASIGLMDTTFSAQYIWEAVSS
jgi:hypothetical protein